MAKVTVSKPIGDEINHLKKLQRRKQKVSTERKKKSYPTIFEQ